MNENTNPRVKPVTVLHVGMNGALTFRIQMLTDDQGASLVWHQLAPGQARMLHASLGAFLEQADNKQTPAA